MIFYLDAEILLDIFVDIVSAKVRDGGISGRQISRVARETVMAKKIINRKEYLKFMQNTL
jgi:hypothetical protein